jgi:formylmethanofuran dehydrogenase subunit C
MKQHLYYLLITALLCAVLYLQLTDTMVQDYEQCVVNKGDVVMIKSCASDKEEVAATGDAMNTGAVVVDAATGEVVVPMADAMNTGAVVVTGDVMTGTVATGTN